MSVPVYLISRPLLVGDIGVTAPYSHWAIRIGDRIFEFGPGHWDEISLQEFEGEFPGVSHSYLLGNVEGTQAEVEALARKYSQEIFDQISNDHNGYDPLGYNCLYFAKALAYKLGVIDKFDETPQCLCDVIATEATENLIKIVEDTMRNKCLFFIVHKSVLLDEFGNEVCSVMNVTCIELEGLRLIFEEARLVDQTDPQERQRIRNNLKAELERIHKTLCQKFPLLAAIPFDAESAADKMMEGGSLDQGFSQLVNDIFRFVSDNKAALENEITDITSPQLKDLANLVQELIFGRDTSDPKLKKELEKFGTLLPAVYAYHVFARVQSESDFGWFNSTIDPTLEYVQNRIQKFKLDAILHPTQVDQLAQEALKDINDKLKQACKELNRKVFICNFVLTEIFPGTASLIVVGTVALALSAPYVLFVAIPLNAVIKYFVSTHLQQSKDLEELGRHLDNIQDLNQMLENSATVNKPVEIETNIALMLEGPKDISLEASLTILS
eukprot:Phypoly_transcript_07113.p1 GENE.Phypoly_transcript_07113~~Phypoly_transcript_07113.p1  ORF type:complete len:498 (+),score=73.79 Phypoly_transcript_07113:145-1638(+)